MTLGGLWHGASWNFALWGALHGLLLVGHRLFRDLAGGRPWVERGLHSAAGSAACVLATFLTVCLTWVLFRAPSPGQAGLILHRLFVHCPGQTAPVHLSGLLYTYLVVAACHWLASSARFRRLPLEAPAPVAGMGYAALLTLTLLLAPASGKAFIYFQF